MSQNESTSDFDSINLLAILLKHKWFIITLTVLATIGVTIYAFTKPNQYTGVVNAVPPKTSDSFDGALSAVSSTLKDLGVARLNGSSKDSYDFIVILNSRSILDSMINHFDLIKRYEIPNKNYDLAREALLQNLDISLEREGNYTITCWDSNPGFAADMANTFVAFSNKIALNMFRKETDMNLGFIQDRFNSIDNHLKELTDSLSLFSKQTKLIAPEEQAKSISNALSDIKSQSLQYQMLYDFSKKLYGDDDYRTQYVKQLQEQSQSSLENIMNKPGFAGNFPLSSAADIGMKYLNLYTELETYAKLKNYTLPMLEKAKLDQSKNLQNLIVIDAAVPAMKKDRPHRSIVVLGTFVGTFALSIMLVLLWANFRATGARLREIKNLQKSN